MYVTMNIKLQSTCLNIIFKQIFVSSGNNLISILLHKLLDMSKILTGFKTFQNKYNLSICHSLYEEVGFNIFLSKTYLDTSKMFRNL